jgi:hypothetical protein
MQHVKCEKKKKNLFKNKNLLHAMCKTYYHLTWQNDEFYKNSRKSKTHKKGFIFLLQRRRKKLDLTCKR